MAFAFQFDDDFAPGRRPHWSRRRGRRSNGPGRPHQAGQQGQHFFDTTMDSGNAPVDGGERPGPSGRGSGRGGRRGGFGPAGPGADFGPAGPGAGFGPGGPSGPGGPGGPGGWGPFGDRGGRGPRRRGRQGRRGARGDVRAAILLLLDEEPMHGYQLIQQMAERSSGVWRPSPGSVYPTLSQLADEGLIQVTTDEGRNVASLTETGKAYLDEHRDQLGTPWDEVAGSVKEEAFDVKGEIGAVMGAVHQVLRVGSADQVGQATKVLAETRKAIYRILAEDDQSKGS
jgi:DNA-binding PadR family transcriptional regulator